MPLPNPNSTRPKRLLSLDGGGIRGLIAAEVLIRIEDLLKELKPGLTCLADYFDFIGGTSTGAILAAGLSKGMTARQLRDIYYNDGHRIFTKNFILFQLWSKYSAEPIEETLQREFAGITLGSDQLKTLLMIVAKNTTTGSTWFFVNNPRNPFYNTNSKIPLWHIIRASSAAPTYFPPHQFQIGDRTAEFVDGGITPYNNPSFQLFLEATQPEYNVNWNTGVDRLLEISVGTGFSVAKIPNGKAKDYTLLNWAPYTVDTLINGANVQQNLLMDLIGKVPKTNPHSTTVAGTELVAQTPGIPPVLAPQMQVLQAVTAEAPKLLTYRRYTTSFTEQRFQQLQRVPGLDPRDADLIARVKPEDLDSLDSVDQRDLLCAIGRAIALEQVRKEIFEPFVQND